MKNLNFFGLSLTLMAFAGCSDKAPDQKTQEAEDLPTNVQDISKLQIRGGLGYLRDSEKVYTGSIKGETHYEDTEQCKFQIKLEEGKATELQTWYANGTPSSWCELSLDEFHTLEKLIDALRDMDEDFPLHGIKGFVNPYKVSGFHKSNGLKMVERSGNLMTQWYENGQKSQETIFKDGRHDIIQWHENGEKRQEATLKDKLPHGQMTQWYDNGQIKFEGTFEDGEPAGPITTWDENGKKTVRSKDGKILED